MQNSNLIQILNYIENNLNKEYSNYKIEYIKESKNIELYFYNKEYTNKNFIQFNNQDIYIWINFKQEYINLNIQETKNIINILFL